MFGDWGACIVGGVLVLLFERSFRNEAKETGWGGIYIMYDAPHVTRPMMEDSLPTVPTGLFGIRSRSCDCNWAEVYPIQNRWFIGIHAQEDLKKFVSGLSGWVRTLIAWRSSAIRC